MHMLLPTHPPTHSRKEMESGMVSSEDFVQFMEGLQASKNIIPDVSGSLSMAMYSTEQTRGMCVCYGTVHASFVSKFS